MHAMQGYEAPVVNQGSTTSILPEKICDAGRLMFDRRLTDLAGGNISAREGDIVYMSPRFAGQRYHWTLNPENLVVGKWADDEIALNPAFSREGWSHLFIYRNFPKVQAVIHAHPMNVMPFTSSCRTIEPLLEGTQKFGLIGYCDAAPGHTKKLGEKVVKAMQGKEELMRVQALPILIPYHGIILAGEDFDKTLDALERVDQNAYCIISRRLLD